MRRWTLKILFLANTEWYLYNFRLELAKFLREREFDVIMISPAGPYAARLQAEGFRWIELAMKRRSVHPARELAVLRQISSIYAAEKPDIVHHFTIKCVVYGSLMAWWHGIHNRVNAVAGMGYVFTSDSIRARILRPIVRALMKSVAGGNRARLIAQNSDDFAALCTSRLARRENIRLIRGSGVNIVKFRPREGTRDMSPTRVLFAARLLTDKGIAEFIDAARHLKQANVAVEFLLAGMPDAGNPTSILLAQVAQWEGQGLVRYLGHVDDMPSLLDQVDMAVLPSYREGAPRSLIEAAAAGLPIVTTDVPGCREIVEHGVNGLLVPPRQVLPLVEAIRFLHERPQERWRMGQAGREKVQNEYDQRIIFEQTLAVYHELLANSPDASKRQAKHQRA
jgi:glycosyltransferase involved in cell wall biosynthesis